jgi:hypothetical protein
MKILLTIFLLLGTVGCSSIGLENEKKGMKLQKKEFEKAVTAKQKVAEKVVFKSQNPERWVKKTDN